MFDDMTLPNLQGAQVAVPSAEAFSSDVSAHAPRFLLLYGSLRERSFSRLVIE